MSCHYKFEHVSGYFIDYVEAARQSEGAKVATQPDFGLLKRDYADLNQSDVKDLTQWEKFTAHLSRLNDEDPTVSYKLVFLTRHGLGFHNVQEAKVGRDAWNTHWAKLEGDGNVTWLDAKLVDEGIQQAKHLASVWASTVVEDKMQLPETLYTSPLARCLETTRLVFADLMTRHGRPFHPIVKELLRERMTDHTCDKRSSRSWIAAHYPDYVIEPGLTEEDVLWRADRWEPSVEHVARKQLVLEDIFASDPSPVVSLTVHSYAVSAILDVVGAPHFRVREGSTVPLLVKATAIKP